MMSRASGQARPGAHRFSGTATGAMARMVAAWSRVRRSKQPAAYARKVLLNRHLLERPSPDGLPRACEPCHRGWNRTLVPSLPAVPRRRIPAVTSGQRRLVEVGPDLAVRRRSRSGPPPRQCLPSSWPARSYNAAVGRRTDGGPRRSHPGVVPWSWPDPPHRPRRGGGRRWLPSPGRPARWLGCCWWRSCAARGRGSPRANARSR